MIITLLNAILILHSNKELPIWPRYGECQSTVASVEGTVIRHIPWPFSRPSSIAQDGSLYGTQGGNLCAISPDGKVRWAFQLQKPPAGGMGGYWPGPQPCPALDKKGNIYDGSSNGFACSLTSEGILRWKVRTEKSLCEAPAIGADGTSYFLFKNALYAVSKEGQLKWALPSRSFKSPSHLGGIAAPSIGPDGTIYLSSASTVIAVLQTGVIKWKTSFRDAQAYQPSSPTISTDGTIYLCCDRVMSLKDSGFVASGGLVAISTRGKVLWKFRQQYGSIYPPAIGKNGDIYFGSYDGLFYSINRHGKENWRFDGGHDAQGTPAISTDGSVYFLSGTGLHALSPSGKLLWEHPFFVGHNTSPVFAPKGPLYLLLFGEAADSIGQGTQLYSFK